MDISRISAVAAVFDSLYGPACGSCGGGVVYGGNHCFGFYSCLYWNCAVALLFQKRGILAGLIAFAEAYDQSKQDILKEMLVPYAVTDRTGRLLWMNREFSLILGEDKTAAPNLTALFPEVTKEMLATGGETVSIHSSYLERNYRVDLRELAIASLSQAVADNGLETGEGGITAVYLMDETQTLKYKQQVNDQKLVAGLIYLDNYEEALESVEEVRRSLLTAPDRP